MGLDIHIGEYTRVDHLIRRISFFEERGIVTETSGRAGEKNELMFLVDIFSKIIDLIGEGVVVGT